MQFALIKSSIYINLNRVPTDAFLSTKQYRFRSIFQGLKITWGSVPVSFPFYLFSVLNWFLEEPHAMLPLQQIILSGFLMHFLIFSTSCEPVVHKLAFESQTLASDSHHQQHRIWTACSFCQEKSFIERNKLPELPSQAAGPVSYETHSFIPDFLTTPLLLLKPSPSVWRQVWG